ncbi:MAG: hypothetical protein J7501_09285 [Bdellovibrio sp.]|nr:hypothetical protein [Bdellovibrio sp.]
MFQKLIIAVLVFTSSMAFANGLLSKNPNTFVTAEDEVVPATASCGDLAKLVQEYSAGRRTLQSSMIADYYDTSNVMNSWYASLSANYGKKVIIPYGAFDVISQSAVTTVQNAQGYTKKDSVLMARLDQIVLLAAKCTQ